MSNPFDQFAAPMAAPPAAPEHGGGYGGYGAPPPPPAYGFNPAAPPVYGQNPAAPPVYGGGPPSTSPYGAPPPQPYGGGYGQPPPVGSPARPGLMQQQPDLPPDAGNPFGAPDLAAAPAAPAVDVGNPFAGGPPEPAPFADPWGTPPVAAEPPRSSYAEPPLPFEQPPANPYGAPPPQQPYGAPPPPYGVPEQQPPPQPAPYGAPPMYGASEPDLSQALVLSQMQTNPYAQPSYGAPPYGGAQPSYGQPAYGQPPPPPPAVVDPFSVFQSSTSSAPPPGPGAMVPHTGAAPPPASDDDFWGTFSLSKPADEPATAASETTPRTTVAEEKKGDDSLPPGGEWYDAKIFTPTLGVMFFKPQELTDSLFLNTDRSIVDSLGDRPVVAFIVEGSSARSAGVELGHVLLKVNGVDVKNPKDASRLIKEGPRPLPMLFYVPNSDVVVAEGEHMVKYDTRDTTAPNSAKDWKPKYVVIGGIIAQPWMMNMYRSKSEYDIAVIETQARRPVSVKVKQFSLQGARIQNDWQGPQMVKYKNKLQPWKYIVVLPVARNPIKISSPSLAQLKPVHEGIRRVLLAQQRDRGSSGRGGGSSSQRQPPQSSYDARQSSQSYDGQQQPSYDGGQQPYRY